jgi:hypothetical protein
VHLSVKIVLVGLMTWCALVALHFFYEAIWMAFHFLESPKPCGRWWCPHHWILCLERRMKP